MIVRNEEQNLSECLDSVKNVVDEIIVIDTGSTDETVGIAESYGAQVEHFPWCDDFSKARNESIKYASGDWILWLDADERLLPESIPVLQDLLRPVKKPTLYKVHIRNIKEDGRTYTLSDAHRLFSNHFGLEFTGRIHEQLVESARVKGGLERDTDVVLYHTGYGLTGEQKQEKFERNIALLQKMVKDNPRDAYAHYKIGQQYGLMDRLKPALEHYQLALKYESFTQQMRASLFNVVAETYLKLNELSAAREYADKSLRLIPNQAAAYYIQYRIADAQKDWSSALDWLTKLQQQTDTINGSKKQTSIDVMINPGQLSYTRGILCLKLNNPTAARDAFLQALDQGLDLPAVRKSLVNAYVTLNDFAAAEEVLEQLIEEFPEELDYWATLGTIKIKQQDYFSAVQCFEHIISRDPAHELALKRLIGLYGKTGATEKAHNTLLVLNEIVGSKAVSP